MRVLVVGGGGREHALVWGAARGRASVDEVVRRARATPGSPRWRACVPVDAADPRAVAQLADDLDVDLVVVGPEEPLVARRRRRGAARAGRLAFGPDADGARLEGSKAWMKEVLADAGVPTARHATFGADDEDARARVPRDARPASTW